MYFANLIRIVRAILAIGFPPSIEDENALRNWVNCLVSLLKTLAAESAIDVDDKAIAILEKIVTNETAWRVGYTLLRALFYGDATPVGQADLADQVVAAIPAPEDGKVEAIDPATIIAIVTAVMELIKAFRERRQS